MFPVARVGSIVKVGSQTGTVITGATSQFVDGGGAGGGDGTSDPSVAIYEAIGMETEDMSPTEKRAYLESKYGAGAADSLMRATSTQSQDPGSQAVSPLNANSSPVSCSTFTNSSPDSTQVSKYFTVAMLSNALYESGNDHTIPATSAIGLSRAQTICNLSFLAKNSLDAFQDWLAGGGTGYTMKIGSGFRNNSGTSDHNKGSAADLHIFSGSSRISREQLRQLAISFVNTAKIPYTQCLLEYAGNSSNGWIHLANRQTGGISSMPVGYTFSGGAPYSANLPKSA